MRSLFIAPLLGLCFSAAAAAQSSGVLSIEKSFPAGGTVAVTVNVGDVKIMPDDSGRVRLEIHSEIPMDHQTMASWVREFDVSPQRAAIDLHLPKGNSGCDHCDLTVFLYVPAQSSLKAELGVGDLTIQGLRGDQNVHTGIGDLRIDGVHPSDYGHVETHTRIGDISDALNRSGGPSGFLGKDEDFTLSGSHHLQASVGVGDIHIEAAGNP